MKNAQWKGRISSILAGAMSLTAAAADLPEFQEVFRLVRSNLVGISESELNRAAVEGLIEHLHPRVMLVTNAAPAGSATGSAPLLAQSRVFDRALAYVRLGAVEAGAVEAFDAALTDLARTNRLEGLVLDLRFAHGTDYAEAGRLADRFVATERLLLEGAEGKIRSTAKTNAVTWPTAVLVNHATAGAAEVLAGVLREAEVSLLLGSATAGHAHLFREYPLSSGQRLQIAHSVVRLGEGREVPATGLTPDIAIPVKLEDERRSVEDPYRVVGPATALARRGADIAASPTNRPGRINEADLVRMRRQGISLDDDDPRVPPRPLPAETPLVTDPVLGRALDLLKGLAVFSPRRSR